MKQKDLVSVIIPTYNREKIIIKSVQSVLNQTYSNLEVIVVDDGSTDNTQLELKKIKDPRLKIIYQNNKGACAARNNGIKNSNGKYIAFNDSDDIWLKNKLEKQMQVMQVKHPDIIFCKINMKNSNGEFVKMDGNYKEGFLHPISSVMGISTQTLLFKKEVLMKNKFDETFPRYQEFELLLRLIPNHSIYCVDMGLVNKNVSNDSISVNHTSLVRAINLILNKYPNLSQEYPLIYSQLEQNVYFEAKQCLKVGDKKHSKILLDTTEEFKGTIINNLLKKFRNKTFLIAMPVIKKIYSE